MVCFHIIARKSGKSKLFAKAKNKIKKSTISKGKKSFFFLTSDSYYDKIIFGTFYRPPFFQKEEKTLKKSYLPLQAQLIRLENEDVVTLSSELEIDIKYATPVTPTEPSDPSAS